MNRIPFVPDSVGAYAADMVLNGRIPGLTDEEARVLAEEELGTGWGSDTTEEDIAARAIEIQQAAEQQLYQAVFDRALGDAQQQQPVGMRMPGSGDMGVGEPVPFQTGDGHPSGGVAPGAPGLGQPSDPRSEPMGLRAPDEPIDMESGLIDRRGVSGQEAGLRHRGIIGEAWDQIRAGMPDRFVRDRAAVPVAEATKPYVDEALPEIGGYVSGLFGGSDRQVPRQVEQLDRELRSGGTPSAQSVEKALRYYQNNPRARDQLGERELLILRDLRDQLRAGELD